MLATALSDVANLARSEQRGRSDIAVKSRRMQELDDQIARYDAQRQSRRQLPNFRSGQALLQSLMRGAQPDPPYVATARAELKTLKRDLAVGNGNGSGGNAGQAAADAQLAAAVGRLTDEVASGGSYRMLVDTDLLARQRIADCVAWRAADGSGLPRSLDALGRYDRASRTAMEAAAAGAAPRVRNEIAAASDTGTLQRIRASYMGTPAAAAAMDTVGVTQALADREAIVQRSERAVASAAQSRRDAESARLARVQAAEQARADAVERATIARQRASQGGGRLAANGGSGGSPASGEPTETQMRAALQANGGRVASRLGMGDMARITYFEKVGCEKAQGRIGWQCDYLTRMDGNPVTGFLDALAGPNTAMRGSARFVLRANGWDAFVEQDRN